MADTFPVSGNIDPTSFPHLLVDLHRQGATGSLKVDGPVHPKALYFRGGRILFGSSNDPRDQLGAILIESGKITREQLDEVNAKVGPGNPLAKVLAESGFVNQRELGDAARVKVERILSDMLSWETGSFEFEDGVLPKGAIDLKLSTGRLLLAAVQRIGERSFALRHLRGDLGLVLEAVPEQDAVLEDIRAEVWPLLERLDGERSLQDAVALTRLDEFEAAKTACALLFLGVARVKEAPASEELDLAQEARSGLDEAPAAVPVQPESLVIPPDNVSPSFPALDAEPLSPEFAGESPSATVAFMPEAAPAAAPPEPVPLADPEPPPRVEPTGFAFAEGDPAPFVAPVPEEIPTPMPVEIPPPEPTVVLPVEPSAPEVVEPLPIEPTVVLPVEGSEPIPWAAPTVAPPSPGPELGTPSRSRNDTVPGDRPVYVPPVKSPDAPPVGIEGDAPAAPAATRPSKEDLAALDALLNPSADRTSDQPKERPRSETWEPQFRTGNTVPPRRAVGRSAPTSRAPLVGGLVVVVIAVVAGGYFWLGRSSTPVASPAPPAPPVTAPAATPELSAPATVAAAPPEATTPPPGPTTIPVAPAGSPASAPPAEPTPPPTAAPVAPPLQTSPAGGPAALLRQGSLAEAARAFASALATGPGARHGIQALVACSPDTVHKAVQNVPGDDLFILPVEYKGRDCYRICWGVFPDRAAAEAAASDFPDYFRQNGIRPRIQSIAELLP